MTNQNKSVYWLPRLLILRLPKKTGAHGDPVQEIHVRREKLDLFDTHFFHGKYSRLAFLNKTLYTTRDIYLFLRNTSMRQGQNHWWSAGSRCRSICICPVLNHFNFFGDFVKWTPMNNFFLLQIQRRPPNRLTGNSSFWRPSGHRLISGSTQKYGQIFLKRGTRLIGRVV